MNRRIVFISKVEQLDTRCLLVASVCALQALSFHITLVLVSYSTTVVSNAHMLMSQTQIEVPLKQNEIIFLVSNAGHSTQSNIQG